MTASANTLSAAEHARLDTYMIEIAVEVRGRAIPDSAGRYRFGGLTSLCASPKSPPLSRSPLD